MTKKPHPSRRWKEVPKDELDANLSRRGNPDERPIPDRPVPRKKVKK
jgi:hypothetical protein